MGQSRPVYRVLEALRADAAVWDRLESAQQRAQAGATGIGFFF